MNRLINFDRYSLHDQDSAQRAAAVDRARAELHDDGCAVVRDIVPPETLAALHGEIVADPASNASSATR